MHDDLYQMYLEEIEEITPCEGAENARLLPAAAAGDEAAKNRLMEGNLKRALSFVEEYEEQGVLLNDLVQEANMALVLAVENFTALAAKRAGDRQPETGEGRMMLPEGAFESYLEEVVKTALAKAVEEQAAEGKAEEEILARVNVLKDVSQVMAEELGREATMEELAERMKMTADEVKDIMKLTLDAMSVTDGYEE